MNRRNYLATIGATVTVLSFAGCSEITSEITSEVDGDLVVDKTVIGSSQYTFEASEGDTINIWANNAEGRVAYISIVGTEDRLDERVIENFARSVYPALVNTCVQDGQRKSVTNEPSATCG